MTLTSKEYGLTGTEKEGNWGLVVKIGQTDLQKKLAAGPTRTEESYSPGKYGPYAGYYERRSRLREGRVRIQTLGDQEGRDGHGWSGSRSMSETHARNATMVATFGAGDAINNHFDAKLLEMEAREMAKEAEVAEYEDTQLPLFEAADRENIELQADEVHLECDKMFERHVAGASSKVVGGKSESLFKGSCTTNIGGYLHRKSDGDRDVHYNGGYDLLVKDKSELKSSWGKEFTYGNAIVVSHAAYVNTSMLVTETCVGIDTRVNAVALIGMGMIRMWATVGAGARTYGGLCRLDKHLMPKYDVFHQKGGVRKSNMKTENRIAGTHLRAWYIFGPRNRKPGYVKALMAKEEKTMAKKENAAAGGSAGGDTSSVGGGAEIARPDSPLPEIALESRATYESSSLATQQANRIVGDLSQELLAAGSQIKTPDGIVPGVAPQVLANNIVRVVGDYSDDVAIALIHNARQISLEAVDEITAYASNYAASFNVAEGSSSKTAGSIIASLQQTIEWSNNINARLFDFGDDAVQRSFESASWIADLTDDAASSTRAAQSAIVNLADVSRAATGRGISLATASTTYPTQFADDFFNSLDDLTGFATSLDDAAQGAGVLDDLAYNNAYGSTGFFADSLNVLDDSADLVNSAYVNGAYSVLDDSADLVNSAYSTLDDLTGLATSLDDAAQGAGVLDDLAHNNAYGSTGFFTDPLNVVGDSADLVNNAYGGVEFLNDPLSVIDDAALGTGDASGTYSRLGHFQQTGQIASGDPSSGYSTLGFVGDPLAGADTVEAAQSIGGITAGGVPGDVGIPGTFSVTGDPIAGGLGNSGVALDVLDDLSYNSAYGSSSLISDPSGSANWPVTLTSSIYSSSGDITTLPPSFSNILESQVAGIAAPGTDSGVPISVRIGEFVFTQRVFG